MCADIHLCCNRIVLFGSCHSRNVTREFMNVDGAICWYIIPVYIARIIRLHAVSKVVVVRSDLGIPVKSKLLCFFHMQKWS